MATYSIPRKLVELSAEGGERQAWVDRLPQTLALLEQRWSLRIGEPIDGEEVSCSWVAPVRCADGSSAVLKVGFPHMEATHEIDGLRFWDGDPTVRLLAADVGLNALLLERCQPGTVLRSLPEPEQDVVLSVLLHRLWRTPPDGYNFRLLAEMASLWADETRDGLESSADAVVDRGLVREGLHLWDELPRTAPREALLATDLHAGNVLRASRQPWLVIDPKPFFGDIAYDATQHLFNCKRLHTEPLALVRRYAELLEVDFERIRLWAFTRAAAEWPRPLHERWVRVATTLSRG